MLFISCEYKAIHPIKYCLLYNLNPFPICPSHSGQRLSHFENFSYNIFMNNTSELSNSMSLTAMLKYVEDGFPKMIGSTPVEN